MKNLYNFHFDLIRSLFGLRTRLEGRLAGLGLRGLIFWVALNPAVVQAQWATVSAGGNDTVGALVMSSSVGEVMVHEMRGGGLNLQFGVQQAYRSFVWVGARMKGRVMYATTAGVPMGQVQVTLLDSGQVVGTTTSDAAGYFDLGLVGGGTYQLQLSTTAAWRGVNTTDALVVMRHFTGSLVLSGLRLEAGNVNLRGLVNGQEALAITRRKVQHIMQLPSGDWAFQVPPIEVQTGDTLVNVPVSALSYGDVNASYFPNPAARLSGEPLLAAGRLFTGSGERFEWPIYLTEAMSIGAMTLEFLVPEGLEIRGVEIPGHRGQSVSGPVEDWGPSAALASGGGHLLYRQEGDVLRVSWFGLNPLVLEKGAAILRLLVQGKPGAMLRLSPTSELADETATPYGFFRLAAPVPGHDSWQVVLLPNPTATTANLALTLPGEGQLQYTVVDALGREVHRGDQVYTTAGYYEVLLPSQTWASGTYSVSLQWQGRTSTEQRMLRLVKAGN